jgi:AbiV family abortive infection protein
MALAILSIEESGKTGILRGLAAASDEQSLRSAWRDYRTHTKKNVMWPIMFEVTSGARRAGDFAKLFDDGAEHPQLSDAVKQVSLCTDCVADCQWWIPEKVVDADTTKFTVRVAELMVKQNIVTTEEIELWIAILRPHWNGSDQERAAAVCAWDKEMRRRGLIKGDVTMEQFFRDGIPDPGKP